MNWEIRMGKLLIALQLLINKGRIKMKYIVDQNITLDQLINLYSSIGWSSYTQNPWQLQKAVANSLFAISAYNHNQLVGLI